MYLHHDWVCVSRAGRCCSHKAPRCCCEHGRGGPHLTGLLAVCHTGSRGLPQGVPAAYACISHCNRTFSGPAVHCCNPFWSFVLSATLTLGACLKMCLLPAHDISYCNSIFSHGSAICNAATPSGPLPDPLPTLMCTCCMPCSQCYLLAYTPNVFRRVLYKQLQAAHIVAGCRCAV